MENENDRLPEIAGTDLSLSVPELLQRVERGQGDKGDAMRLASELAWVLQSNMPAFLKHHMEFLTTALRAIANGGDANEAFHLTGKSKELPYNSRLFVAELMVQIVDDLGWGKSRKSGGILQAAKEVSRVLKERGKADLTPLAVRKIYFDLRGPVQSRRHQCRHGHRNR